MTQKKMKAFVLQSPGNMGLEDLDLPAPLPDEASVRIRSVGVCGSDVHYLRHGRIGSFVVKAPLILGHECSGEVVALGSEVGNLSVGDRVVLEPGVPCKKCWYCRNGRYTKCPHIKFLATPPDDGALVEYKTWPADYLFKMPDEMTFQEGALVEPFAVGLYAVRRSGLYPSASVAILGSGPIGLATLQAAKACGAGQIIMVDLMENRMKLAKEMGASHVLDARQGSVAQKIKDLTRGEGAHFVYETAGTAKTFQQTVEMVRDGGSIVLIGLPQEEQIPMPMVEALIKEVNFITSFRYNNIFEEAITLMENRRVNVKPLITHEFPFAQTLEAFDTAENAKDQAVKVMINL
ncbi:MAG: NAD(P)-dependent alcohol dehydrogenase [Desulfobacterales bacterium]|nr:MAG: NAD(P)-dependent alcohol dehydrogenase [Desulfobacterales bacterium]